MKSVREWMYRFVANEEGIETVEWGVIAAILVAGLVGVMTTLGSNVLSRFTALRDATQ